MSDATSRILAERAAALARPQEEAGSAEEIEVLGVVIADARFALPASYVRAVVPLDSLTTIPCVSEPVAGVMNFRGGLLAVVDIRARLALREYGIANFHKVVVLEGGEMTFGVLVDGVDSVIRLDRNTLGTSAGPYLGTTADGLSIIDAHALLTDDDLVVQEHVAPLVQKGGME